MGFRIGLAYNVKSEYVFKPGDPPDANAEFDNEDTIAVIEAALRAGGHQVVRLGHVRQLLQRLDDLKAIDIVFNLAEGDEGRNRESQVPIILEMLRVPFVGADGLSLGMTLDKIITKKLLIAEGIPTPRFAELSDPEKAWQVDLTYPLITKLRYEGSSKGITSSSLVNTPQELKAQVQRLVDTYHESVLVEEFIEGQEFTVAVIGNDPPEPQPVVQIKLDGTLDLGRRFYTFAHIRSGADYVCPAPIPEALREELQALALRTYQAVESRDFGRVDVRVDRAGRPSVLEINPLPSLSTEDVFMYVAKVQGKTYAQVINRILDAALIRCGLKSKEEVLVPSTVRSPSRTI